MSLCQNRLVEERYVGTDPVHLLQKKVNKAMIPAQADPLVLIGVGSNGEKITPLASLRSRTGHHREFWT
jgi:hypothetical protein